MGGLSLRERHRSLERFLKHKVISVDQSKYDRHLWFVRECLRVLGKVILPPVLIHRWLDGLSDIEQVSFKHAEGLSVEKVDPQLYSGEPATSLFGTLFNVFITWLADGESDQFFKNGNRVDEVVANGDDKIDTIAFERSERVCSNLGLEVTLEGRGGLLDVPFLGRYHFLLYGRIHSCSQFYRALSKFHYSATKGDRIDLLCGKACCYLCTDYNTPVLGAMAYHIVSNYGANTLGYTEHFKTIVDLGVKEFLQMGPPRFCEEAAAIISLHEGVSIAVLRSLHGLALRGQFPSGVCFEIPSWFTDYAYL